MKRSELFVGLLVALKLTGELGHVTEIATSRRRWVKVNWCDRLDRALWISMTRLRPATAEEQRAQLVSS